MNNFISKIILSILFTFLLFSPLHVEGALPPDIYTSNNILVKSEGKTFLDKATTTIAVDNLRFSVPSPYYSARFHGVFKIKNDSDKNENVAIGYPRGYYSRAPSTLNIKIDGKNFDNYEIMNDGDWVNKNFPAINLDYDHLISFDLIVEAHQTRKIEINDSASGNRALYHNIGNLEYTRDEPKEQKVIFVVQKDERVEVSPISPEIIEPSGSLAPKEPVVEEDKQVVKYTWSFEGFSRIKLHDYVRCGLDLKAVDNEEDDAWFDLADKNIFLFYFGVLGAIMVVVFFYWLVRGKFSEREDVLSQKFFRKNPITFIFFLLYSSINVSFSLIFYHKIDPYHFLLLLPMVIYLIGRLLWTKVWRREYFFNPTSIFFAIIGFFYVNLRMFFYVHFLTESLLTERLPFYVWLIMGASGLCFGYLLGVVAFYIERSKINFGFKVISGLVLASIILIISKFWFLG